MRPCLAPWPTVSSRTVSCLAFDATIEEYGKQARSEDELATAAAAQSSPKR